MNVPPYQHVKGSDFIPPSSQDNLVFWPLSVCDVVILTQKHPGFGIVPDLLFSSLPVLHGRDRGECTHNRAHTDVSRPDYYSPF